jgi:hypothetical protein
LAVWPLLVTSSTVTANLFNPGFRVLATRSLAMTHRLTTAV